MNLLPVASTDYFTIPDGPSGTRETLKHMRELVRRGKLDPRVRDLAQKICAGVPQKNWQGEIVAIFQFVRSSMRYSLDPNGMELIQGAAQSLGLRYGDCDDFCIILATLLECMGHPCMFCALGTRDERSYEHVVVLCSGAGEDDWMALDATEPYPPGWFPPGVTCAMLAPIE